MRAEIDNQDKAQKDYTHLPHLRKEDSGTISIRRLEVSQATLDQARAQVAAARANIQQAIEQKGGNNDENNAILNTAITAVEKAELDLEREITNRHANDMASDSWLSKNIRPMLTIFSLFLYTLFALIDGNIGEFNIANQYVDLLGQIVIMSLGFYFISKGI